jgi:hypothetical protein
MGVQGPAHVKMSETTIIKTPVTKPCIGPKTKPETNVKVSAKPIFTTTPYIGIGKAKATQLIPTLTAAAVATNNDIAESCFTGIFISATSLLGWIIQPTLKSFDENNLYKVIEIRDMYGRQTY